MTTEEKALIWARRQKGNVLNNKNVDCFIAGYEMASKECRDETINDRIEFLKKLPESLKKEIENSGYVFSKKEKIINTLLSKAKL